MSVRVVARIRPLLDGELDKDTIVRAESSQDGKVVNVVRIPNPKNLTEEFSFTFNAVYPMSCTQEELFTHEVAPTLKSLFQGLDVTLFAYGVTGTGKTHTMQGGKKLSDRGVIPRLLSGAYRRAKKVSKDSGGETTVTVKLSYFEIYNDKVYDLFEPPDKRSLAGLPLREKDGKTIVVGLSERDCGDLKEFEKLYIEANNNRSTAGTKLNAQSSRSHAILMVKVTQTSGNEILTSTASAIDLAGSEDNRRTDNGKERLVESASINKSLFVLSQCIDAIGRGDKRIPYRESKMTRILSLGQNNGITIMILNLAPLRSYHLDTLSSLNVSSRAKRIEVREIENEVVFTQAPRKLASASLSRQPLRPITNGHNAHVSIVKEKADKPKPFAVYTDKTKSPALRKVASNKRQAETELVRPTKMVRPNPTGIKSAAPGLSAAKIEEMVERKVGEILAARAMDKPAPQAEISEAVQRRLDDLERKIESGTGSDDARTEGLRFLLMAKQHKERDEYTSALMMYEMALPFFPGQEKLLRKIEGLKTRIAAKKEEAVTLAQASGTERKKFAAPIMQLPTPETSFENIKEDVCTRSRKTGAATESDDEYNASGIQLDDDFIEDDSFAYRSSKAVKSSKKAKTAAKASLKIYRDDTVPAYPEAATPKTSYLLEVVNSRDVGRIKGLSGVGQKKARDLVEFLELQSEEEGGTIRSLGQLRAVPGIGNKTVERAYEGITIT